LNEGDVDYWHIYDDDGQVDPNQERILEHQDHMAIIAQNKDSKTNDDEDVHIQNQKDPVKKFVRSGGWRKIMRTEDAESGSKGHPPLHPTAGLITEISSLPAMEANTAVEGDGKEIADRYSCRRTARKLEGGQSCGKGFDLDGRRAANRGWGIQTGQRRWLRCVRLGK
jgi:hypothetical protein